MDILVVVLGYAGVAWPAWINVVTFVPLFPVFFVALMLALTRVDGVLGSESRSQPRLRDFVRGVPKHIVVLCAVGFYGSWLLIVFNLGIAGQPETINGSYFLNDHGSMTTVTFDASSGAAAQGVPLFTSGSLAFASAAFLLAFSGAAPARNS